MTRTFQLAAQGPFALAASTRFLEGFTPAGYTEAAGQPPELAFPVEGSWATAGVRVRATGTGVTGEILSPADPAPELTAAVRAQVARILSLDVDGSGFPAVGERDPVVGGLQRRYPGLRPVGFWSPYEAAAWAVISQRLRIRQAATIKSQLAEQIGEPVSFGDHVIHAFPAPEQLATLGDDVPGLSGRKPEWLRSLGRSALEGRLDSAHLRAQPYDEAVAGLTELPGIGPFAACRPRRPSLSWADSVRTGGRTAPGSRCCCGPSWRTRPGRSAGIPDPSSRCTRERRTTALRSPNVRRLLFPVRRLHLHQPGDQDVPPVPRLLVRHPPAPPGRLTPAIRLIAVVGTR